MFGWVLAGVEVLGGVKVASRSRAVNCRSACEHRVVKVHVAYTIDAKKFSLLLPSVLWSVDE